MAKKPIEPIESKRPTKPIPPIKVFLDGKYRTTSAHVHDILKDFILGYPLAKTPIFDLRLGESKYDNHKVYYTLGLQRFSGESNNYFDAIGSISIIPVNDIESWIKIIGIDERFTDDEKVADEITAAGNKFLTKFTAHFRINMGDIKKKETVPFARKRPGPKPRKDATWNRMNSKTKGNFKRAWTIYKKMCKEYKEAALDNITSDPKPTTQDFRVRVLSEMNWEVGDRRLREVIYYGEAGLIK